MRFENNTEWNHRCCHAGAGKRTGRGLIGNLRNSWKHADTEEHLETARRRKVWTNNEMRCRWSEAEKHRWGKWTGKKTGHGETELLGWKKKKKLEKHWKQRRANEEDAAQVWRESRQVTGPGSLNTHRCGGKQINAVSSIRSHWCC